MKPLASKVAALEKIKDNDRVTNAPPLGRLRQSVKLPGIYNSLNSLLEKVNPALVVHDKQGKPHTVRYDAMNALLLKKDFQATVAQLTMRLDEQAAQYQKVSAQTLKRANRRRK